VASFSYPPPPPKKLSWSKDRECPSCHHRIAIRHPIYGILPCKECKRRQSQLPKPGKLPEFTSESIKQQRKEFHKDIEQPHRAGQLNKAWMDEVGEQQAKNWGFSDKEIKSAKYVYRGDDTYYKE